MTAPPAHILIDMPYELSDADRQEILRACPSARIALHPYGTSIEQADGSTVDVIVGEEVPTDLVRWPRLRFVQLICSGFDHLKGHPIWATRIPISTGSGNHSVPIAQYVTCTLLAMIHRIVELLEYQRTRRWPDRTTFMSRVVRGMTVGIVGYGSIGRECARQLAALGMRVMCMKRVAASRRDIGFNPWPDTGDPEGGIPRRWFGPHELGEMLPLCDVLLVTAPATPQTTGMIGEAELRLMKKGSRVMAISRGGIVDEHALAGALRSGHLGGAVVDSYEQEPPPADHPLFDAPNVILTPHMSGMYEPYWPQGLKLVCENLRRLLREQEIINRADGSLGY